MPKAKILGMVVIVGWHTEKPVNDERELSWAKKRKTA